MICTAMKYRHPCAQPGCPELIDAKYKYCLKHIKMHPEEKRSAVSRGYNTKWKNFRRWYLATHPFCVKCYEHGKLVEATVVDHIVPFRGDPELQYDVNNLQPLCKRHHDEKTGRYDSHPEYHY